MQELSSFISSFVTLLYVINSHIGELLLVYFCRTDMFCYSRLLILAVLNFPFVLCYRFTTTMVMECVNNKVFGAYAFFSLHI